MTGHFRGDGPNQKQVNSVMDPEAEATNLTTKAGQEIHTKMIRPPVSIAVTAGTLLSKMIISRRVQMKSSQLASPKYSGREDRRVININGQGMQHIWMVPE